MNGSLNYWGSDGPIILHSNTNTLNYWGNDGVFTDYITEETATFTRCFVIIV